MSASVQDFKHAEERVWERYGVTVTTRYLKLRERRLRVRVLECGEGRPLLLVPGDGAIAAEWAPLLAELSGRRAIVLDRPDARAMGLTTVALTCADTELACCARCSTPSARRGADRGQLWRRSVEPVARAGRA